VHADAQFLAYADSGIVFVSGDEGRGWSAPTVVDPPTAAVNMAVLGGMRLFVAVRDGAVETSANGLGWTRRLDGGGGALTALAFVH
jgi:hypothetical protein